MGISTASLSVRSIQYYVNVGRWLSDLDFFKIEAAFLVCLLNDYFARVSDDRPHFEQLKKLEKKLFKLQNDIRQADLKLRNQIYSIEQIAGGLVPDGEEELAERQLSSESLIPKLTAEYRGSKRELFTIIENMIRVCNFFAG